MNTSELNRLVLNNLEGSIGEENVNRMVSHLVHERLKDEKGVTFESCTIVKDFKEVLFIVGLANDYGPLVTHTARWTEVEIMNSDRPLHQTLLAEVEIAISLLAQPPQPTPRLPDHIMNTPIPEKKEIVVNIGTRWEEDIPHHPESIRLMEEMKQVDLENDLALDLKTGGDGDNGEHLMFLMDVVFERRDERVRELFVKPCLLCRTPAGSPHTEYCPHRPR